MTKMRVLFAGGGTAGHINPALTVADILRQEGAEIAFAGTQAGLEKDLVPRAGYRLHTLRVRPMPRRISPALLKATFDAGVGLLQAFRIIGSFKPQVVVGTGGYVAGPVLLAAVLRRVPTVIHEQNAFPGSTNRLLAKWVDRVALGYREAAPRFPRQDKLVYVGNPVRSELLTVSRTEGLRRLGLSPDRRHVLIFGGSRGARSINRAVFAARTALHQHRDVQFVHQTGAAGFPEVVEAYRSAGIEPVGDELILDHNIRVVPYVYDMPAALAAADLAVARAGALTVAEITARGVPSVLVPYPYATDDHQTFNARPLVAAGAARMIADGELTGETLAAVLDELLNDREGLRRMGEAAKTLGRPQAARELADLIRSVARPLP